MHEVEVGCLGVVGVVAYYSFRGRCNADESQFSAAIHESIYKRELTHDVYCVASLIGNSAGLHVIIKHTLTERNIFFHFLLDLLQPGVSWNGWEWKVG